MTTTKNEVAELLHRAFLEKAVPFNIFESVLIVNKVKQEYGSIVAQAILDYIDARALSKYPHYIDFNKARLPWVPEDNLFRASSSEFVAGLIPKILKRVTGLNKGFFTDYEFFLSQDNQAIVFGSTHSARRFHRSACFDKADGSLISCPNILSDYFNEMLSTLYGGTSTSIERGVTIFYTSLGEADVGVQRCLLIPHNVYMEFLADINNSSYIRMPNTGFICHTKTKIQMEHLYTYIKV